MTSQIQPENRSPYLLGNFSPVVDELTTDTLQVIGRIPAELNGLYLRNGPNPQFPPKGQYHWFDGDGMIHGIHLEDGCASYLNRYISTKCYQLESKEGRSLWTGLTGLPNLKQMLFPPAGLRTKNPANTGLVWHADKLLALWEVGLPHEIEVPDLKTIGELDQGLPVKAFSAHPKIEPQRNEMRFFGVQLGRRPTLQYGVVDKHGELIHSAHIALSDNCFMHDFAISRDYTIFLDLPYVFSLKAMLTRGTPFKFHTDRPSRFGIMPRCGQSSDIVWFEDDPCFIYHTLNAYELHDKQGQLKEIVLLACRMPRGVIGSSTESNSRHGKPDVNLSEVGRLHEWRFNLNTGTVQSKPLDDRPGDMPRLNDSYASSYNQFGYTANVSFDKHHGTPLFTGITKYDLHSQSATDLSFGRGRFGGESVFVPRTSNNRGNEDDGWLLNIVFDANIQSSELLIIDAATLDADPVARVQLPQRVPFGFHGTWIPADQISQVRTSTEAC